MIGEKILHYKILEKLGEGGMGVVYLAEDTRLKRNVAVKFLPKYISANEEEKRRFEIEAQAAASLNHPNIATVYAIEEADNNVFMVMEYIEGKELKEKITSPSLPRSKTMNPELLPIDEIIGISVQIAEGLQAAHKKGIVHRDIKSSNIMITEDGKVKITDFGLAKIKGSQLTKAGSTVGTVACMSPEQAKGKTVDHLTDIWSFGVVFYEMLTGELPFNDQYEAATIYQILNEEPKPISSFREDVPENISVLVSKMLEKDVNKRIDSAGKILRILKAKSPDVREKDKSNSIAVLNFENMSPDSENEYFCAGITEDIIIDLSKIKELKVIPRSDVLPFKAKEIKSVKIGEILGVSHILEGSVRKAGRQIRVTAKLIDMHTGYQIWAERYDRLLEDIFNVQIELSQKIAEALKLSLSESEKEMLTQKPTDDLRAHDFYMRGRDYLYSRGKNNNESAIKMLEHAIAIDPNYSLAYVALAEAYSFQYIFYDGNQKWLAMMISAGEKAKELDPNLPEIDVVKGIVFYHQKRFEEGKRILLKFIEKKNDYYPAYYWLGLTEEITKDYTNAIRHFKHAQEIKPYSEEPWLHLEIIYHRIGDLKSSRAALAKMLEVINKKIEIDAKDGVALSRGATGYAILGDRNSALKYLNLVLESSPNDGLALYNCACTYAQLNEKDKALEFLKRALENGHMNFIEWIDYDPVFDLIRDDPKFKEILINAET